MLRYSINLVSWLIVFGLLLVITIGRARAHPIDLGRRAAAPLPFTKELADDETINNLKYFVDLMTVSNCIDRVNGIQSNQTSWACETCSEFPSMTLIKAWSPGTGGPLECTGLLSVDHSTERIHIMLRGTYGTTDILSDLEVAPIAPKLSDKTNSTIKDLATACSSCRIHEGFYQSYINSYKAIEPNLTSTIERYPGYRLVVSGHSLGGAVAALYAAGFKLAGYDNSDLLVVTAGQPVVGNSDFANWFDNSFIANGTWDSNRNYFRMTHLNDVVPLVPFWQGYTQVGGEVFIDYPSTTPPDDTVYFCSGNENPGCSWNISRIDFSMSLASHDEYFDGIGKMCNP